MRRWFPWLLAFFSLGMAQVELKATVVGTGLEWEADRLEVWLLPQASSGRIALYSPGFDPGDYRRALLGEEELGDERYDRGQGELKAVYELYQGSTLLRRLEVGVEPHRWVELFQGPLEAGSVYRLVARFEGLGKNAFVLRAEGFAAQLDPKAFLDLRPSAPGLTLRQLPGERGRFVEALALEVPPALVPFSVRFYDEDGPAELASRVVLPDGRVEEREVSGDRAWAEYRILLPGLTRFLFTQPPTATQYSNTIAWRPRGRRSRAPARCAWPRGRKGRWSTACAPGWT